MTPLEAKGIVLCLVVFVALVGWLIWSNIAGKRQIPGRVHELTPEIEEAIHAGEIVVDNPVAFGLKAPTRDPELLGLCNIVGGRPPETPVRARRADQGPFAFPTRRSAFPYDRERENG